MRIEHWLNGDRVLNARLDTAEIRELMGTRKVPAELPLRSPIVLQNHSSEAWFRNLRIRVFLCQRLLSDGASFISSSIADSGQLISISTAFCC